MRRTRSTAAVTFVYAADRSVIHCTAPSLKPSPFLSHEKMVCGCSSCDLWVADGCSSSTVAVLQLKCLYWMTPAAITCHQPYEARPTKVSLYVYLFAVHSHGCTASIDVLMSFFYILPLFPFLFADSGHKKWHRPECMFYISMFWSLHKPCF